MQLTNRWNLWVYRLWSPVYDVVFTRLFAYGRRRAMALLSPAPGERILLVGVGTGADLPLLPAGVCAVGSDLSPQMLAHARRKTPAQGTTVHLVQGDAQCLPLAAGAFDAALLNLILSVAPDGAACFREAVRALRAGGRTVVFDKFVPDQAVPSRRRRLLGRLSVLVGTDINRRLGDLIARTGYAVVHDEPAAFHGAYRVVLLRRREEPGNAPTT